MKRLPLILLLAVLLVLGAWYGLSHRERKLAAATPHGPANHILLPENAPQRAFIKVEEAVEAPLPAAGPFNGRLTSVDDATAKIFPPVNGRLVKVLVNLGDKVAKGAPLALLDAPDFDAAVADERKAGADAAVKEKVWQRAQALFAEEALSRRELEAAQTDAAVARAEMERARARLANLGGRGDGRYLLLKSPVDGIVLDRQANPGTEVRNEAGNPLLVLADLGKLALLIDLPEQELTPHIGDGVSFSIDTAPQESFNTTLERIAPAVDTVTRRLTVRALVDNRSGRLRPEMYVRAALLSKNATKGLRIPISALLTQGLNATVFVEVRAGDFARQTVKLLRQDRDFAYIAADAGLKRGDRVVTKGAMLLASELMGAE